MAKRRNIDITYDAQTTNYKRKVADAEKFTKNATARMQGSANLLKTASSRLVGGIGGITAGGYLLTSVISKGVRSFVDLENGMRNVNTIIKVSEKQLANYTKQLEKLQSELGVSTLDLTNGFYQAVSAGISAGEAIDFLRIATKASIAGISSVEVAVDGLTNVLNAFHLQTSETTKVADIMFQTVKLGKTNFEQLATSISGFAPLAYSLGLSFEETAGALATITKQGVSTSEAATRLNAVFTGVLKGQERAGSMSKEVAEAFSIQALKTKGLQKFLVDLETALKGDQEAMVKLFGRAEAVQGMLQLTGNNAKMASSDLDAMKNSVNAMGDAFQEQSKKSSESAKRFEQSANRFVQAIAKIAQPMATSGFEGGTTILNYYLTLYEKVGEIIDKISGALPELKKVFQEAGNLIVNPNPLKGSPNLVGGNGLSEDEKNNLSSGRQFIPNVGWVTVKKEIKETGIETEKLTKVFNMYGATQDQITERIKELTEARKEMVMWSNEYNKNLKEEEKLSKYLNNRPVGFTPFGSIDARSSMFADTKDIEKSKLVGSKTYRHSNRDSIDLFGEDWVNESLANEQKLFDDMLFNASELGYALENAFSKSGNSLLSQLTQALQIAINIANALDKNDGSIGGILGIAASFIPGLDLLFGGGKASGGNVNSGMFYKVNENGTEMLSIGNNDYLMMGNNSGNITPNERINLGKISGGYNNKAIETLVGIGEMQISMLDQINESYIKTKMNTKLNASIKNTDIYLSNDKGSKIYKRYHG